MLTESIRRDMCLRLGPYIKYTVSGVYYWHKNLNKLVLCDNNYYWTFEMNYYIGWIFQIFFFIYLWNPAQDLFYPEFVNVQVTGNDTRLLTLVSGVLFWVVIACILQISSITKEYRNEMCTVMTQLFRIDSYLIKAFIADRKHRMPENPDARKMEWLIKFDCIFTSVLPILFGCAMLIPGEPIHSYLEWVLEVKFGWNWETLPLLFMIVWSTNALVGIVLNIIFIFLNCMFIWLFWFRAVCPDASCLRKSRDDGLLFFKTSQVGMQSEMDLIWMYRVFQLIAGLFNIPVKTSRLAFHLFALQVTVVTACFSLIRFHDIMFKGDSIGYVLAFILLICIFWAVVLIVLESFALNEIQITSENFKNNIRYGTSRNLAVNKASRSFQEVTLYTAGPCFRLNKSSFLQWCDQAIDRLVTLLCSF